MKNQHATTTLTINLKAVKENYRILKSMVGGTKIAAAVKANAYGLGIAEIAPALESEGCDIFFVANLDEALELRIILPHAPILVQHGVAPGEEEIFVNKQLIPVLYSTQQITLWQQHAIKLGKKLPCILHFDTGMNRLGIHIQKNRDGSIKQTSIENIRNLLEPGGLDIKYLMSHLACSDDRPNPKNLEQLTFLKSIAKGFPGIELSLANSGGIFLGKEYHLDMARPGAALYGVNPILDEPNPMKNVVTLTSRILQIERIDRSETVGYDASRKVKKGTKIATIAVGYADGYLRSLSNKGICAVDGILMPIIGRVSMDLITVDITSIAEGKIAVGTEVELIGDNIPIDILAEKADTISYELLTSLSARCRRIYK